VKHHFHPEALFEYSESVLYYESCRPSLGMDFIQEIENAIVLITEAPERWKVLEGNFRRLLVKRFPYALVYTVDNDLVIIYAVMHCSRSPGYWKGRTS